MTIDTARLFATLRAEFGPLTQANVDAVNEALGLAEAQDGAPGGSLTPSRAALSLIKEFEGCAKIRPDGMIEAYPDPGTGGEPWTIGWGSTGPGIRWGTVWTQEQADKRFAEHVAEFGEGVAKLVAGGAATSQQEYDALVAFAYNVGLGKLAKSTLLKLHRAGDKAGAAGQFQKWINAGGKPMKGLIRRREAEAKLYRGAA